MGRRFYFIKKFGSEAPKEAGAVLRAGLGGLLGVAGETMNNVARIHEILAQTCTEYRKGAAMVERNPEGGIRSVEFFNMPAAPTEGNAGEDLIDMHFIIVGVDREPAKSIRDELFGLLQPARDMLDAGASYITIGDWLGEQNAALCLMALGSHLEFWRVVTPATLGFEGRYADHVAGVGYLFVSGFRSANGEPEDDARPEDDESGEIDAPADAMEPPDVQTVDRERALAQISGHGVFTMCLDWLALLNDAERGRIHNPKGEISLGLDAAALLVAQSLHNMSETAHSDVQLANLFSLRMGYHLGRIRRAAQPDSPLFPDVTGETVDGEGERIVVICPHCQTAHDAQTMVGRRGEPAHRIGNGDVSVCFNCGEIGIFDDSAPGMLRKPNGMELGNIEANPEVKRALEAWRTAKAIRKARSAGSDDEIFH
jgi:hypothetical protein